MYLNLNIPLHLDIDNTSLKEGINLKATIPLKENDKDSLGAIITPTKYSSNIDAL